MWHHIASHAIQDNIPVVVGCDFGSFGHNGAHCVELTHGDEGGDPCGQPSNISTRSRKRLQCYSKVPKRYTSGLWWTGCRQIQIHQNLFSLGALLEAKWVDDIHKTDWVQTAVSSRLPRPLIPGRDWSEFDKMMGHCLRVCSQQLGTYLCSSQWWYNVLQHWRGDPMIQSREDFPLEQNPDGMLRVAFNQDMEIDGQRVRPDITQTNPFFYNNKGQIQYVCVGSQSSWS